MDDAEVAGPTAALVALKTGESAKSRLAPLPDPLRRRLAWTMAVDTLRALSEAVDRLLVVSRQPSLASRLSRAGVRVEVLAEDARAGMNAALAHGDTHLRGSGVATVLACVGDLPALRPDSVRRVLDLARVHPRSFVPDASGVGTTMLISRAQPLAPRFQGRSAATHHSSGAHRLEPTPSGASLADARRDVDTEVDLADATHLGLGPATAALVGPTGRLGSYQVITATALTHPGGGDQVAITAAGHRVELPRSALDAGLRAVRLGQRLHAVVEDGRVLSAWL